MPVIKRAPKRYAVMREEGRQPARRCVDCNHRVWAAEHDGDVCPKCEGVLGDVVQERRQRYHGVYKRQTDAEDADAMLNVSQQQGTYRPPTRLTVREYLLERWLPAVEPTVKPTTFRAYRDEVANHIVPKLGHLHLTGLGPEHLTAFYGELGRSGRRDGKGLSPKSIQKTHAVLTHALRDAVRWHLIVRNPAGDVDKPKVERKEMRYWDPAQLRTFLAYDPADRLQSYYTTMVTTGARRGELCGLGWAQLDLDAGRMEIMRSLVVNGDTVSMSTPKSKASRRTLTLDPATVAALRAWRKRQVAEQLAAGPAWKDSGMVFTTPTGEAVNPKSVSHAFQQRAKHAGLPVIRLHDLRHSYATAALAAGESYKTIQTRLGHATAAMTLDIYGHVSAEVEVEAAHRIAANILGP